MLKIALALCKKKLKIKPVVGVFGYNCALSNQYLQYRNRRKLEIYEIRREFEMREIFYMALTKCEVM